MWNTSAVTLAAVTAFGLFAISFVLAKRETVDELRNLFDIRLVRRSARSMRRFRIGTLIWLTTYGAVIIAVIQRMGESPIVYLAIPLLTVAFLLARVALSTLAEPSVRRIHPPCPFPTSNASDLTGAGEQTTAVQSSVDRGSVEQNSGMHTEASKTRQGKGRSFAQPR